MALSSDYNLTVLSSWLILIIKVLLGSREFYQHKNSQSVGGGMQMKYSYILIKVFLILSLSLSPVYAAQIKDSESASHGQEASGHRVVDTYTFPGFKVIQFELPVLSVYSYMLISDGQALVVDPVRDIFTYLDMARKESVKIIGVYLSHSHADFIAGHTEMVKVLGCPIYQSEKSGANYKIDPLKEGSAIQVGEAILKFIETPGHTPDGMCAVVYNKSQPETPLLMFTGDVLFVGSVGRPDLLEGTVSAAWLASSFYDAWNQKLSKLGDAVKISPAHGAGSLCGAHLSDEPFSTIGKEKTSNPYLKSASKREFITALLDGLPEAPQYFKHNSRMNREGPPLVHWDAPLPSEIKPDMELMRPEKYYIVDLRDATEYASGHIPNAINIAARGRLENWVGTIVPWGKELILCGSSSELKEAVFRLHRIGYAGPIITMDTWKKAALPVRSSPSIPARELYERMQKGDAPMIVDVRLPEEWMGLRIGKVLNLPLNRLAALAAQLDPSESVVTVCNSAYRSSLAVGVLERVGFQKAQSLEGGSEAWIKAGLPVLEGVKKSTAAETAPKIQVKLPERISAEELKRMLMDLPGTFDLIDIRPAAYFKDFNIPGSKNVDISDLMSNPAFLIGAGSLILIDRDGSIAMAAGGVLSQKTQRSIKVVYGGMTAYWSETEGAAKHISPLPIQTVPETKSSAPSAPPAVPAPQPAQEPAKVKKKSAGC